MQTCRFENPATGEHFTGSLKAFLEAGPGDVSVAKVPRGWRVYVEGSLAGTYESLSTVWVLYLHTQGWRKVVLSDEEVAEAVHDVAIRRQEISLPEAVPLARTSEAILRLIANELSIPHEDVFKMASLVCDKTLRSVWAREGPYVKGLLEAYFAARDA